MDLTTLIGIIMALGLCLWGIGPSKIGNFIDPQSLAIVIGGTIAAVTASYPFRILMDVPKHSQTEWSSGAGREGRRDQGSFFETECVDDC